ncbi:MAG: hypothetical protein M3004_10645 [Bacteroidota bacterium]|nr:hypothetical protein [Bacteroidota bacterium]
MNNFIRTIIAGYGAKKLGGGCLSTVLIFIVLYYLLGTCNQPVQRSHANTGAPIHYIAKTYINKAV